MTRAELVAWLQTWPEWKAGGYPEACARNALAELRFTEGASDLAVSFLKIAEHGLCAVAELHDTEGRHGRAEALRDLARQAREAWCRLNRQGGTFPPPLEELLDDVEPLYSAERDNREPEVTP